MSTKEGVDENGDYYTPDLAYTTQTRVQPTISPEESIVRLISSKTASSGSPQVSMSLKKGIKRIRVSTNISNTEMVPTQNGIAARNIPTLLPLPIPQSERERERERERESAQKSTTEPIDLETAGLVEKKRKVLSLTTVPTITLVPESEDILVSTPCSTYMTMTYNFSIYFCLLLFSSLCCESQEIFYFATKKLLLELF